MSIAICIACALNTKWNIIAQFIQCVQCAWWTDARSREILRQQHKKVMNTEFLTDKHRQSTATTRTMGNFACSLCLSFCVMHFYAFTLLFSWIHFFPTHRNNVISILNMHFYGDEAKFYARFLQSCLKCNLARDYWHFQLSKEPGNLEQFRVILGSSRLELPHFKAPFQFWICGAHPNASHFEISQIKISVSSKFYQKKFSFWMANLRNELQSVSLYPIAWFFHSKMPT